jgi:hypothetical protein
LPDSGEPAASPGPRTQLHGFESVQGFKCIAEGMVVKYGKLSKDPGAISFLNSKWCFVDSYKILRKS